MFFLVFILASASIAASGGSLPDVRPSYSDRTFNSDSVDAYIESTAPQIADPDVATLFSNCLPNTLDTTVKFHDGRNDTFIITGDIDALWLRDSTNQVLPYMRFVAEDPPLGDLLCGLVRRQARSVLLDAYANAFNFNNSGAGHQDDVRQPPMSSGVYEGKYELDSLAAFLKLSRQYFNTSQDADCLLNVFDTSAPTANTKPNFRSVEVPNNTAENTLDSSSSSISSSSRKRTRSTSSNDDDDGAPSLSPSLGCGIWVDAVARTLDVIEEQTLGTASLTDKGWWYTFQRTTQVASDTLSMNGRGPVAANGTGLSQSWFRPSDDAQALPFHVPSNAMALVELVETSTLLQQLVQYHGLNATVAVPLADRATSLAAAIEEGLWQHAVVAPQRRTSAPTDATGGASAGAAGAGAAGAGATADFDAGRLAYEVDGYGSMVFMDDANIPSLLSLPYLGLLNLPLNRYENLTKHPSARNMATDVIRPWDAVYASTRPSLLAAATNPFFFSGSAGEGVGGPHVGWNMAWPMAITMRALTAASGTDGDSEVLACLTTLVNSSVNTGLLHESFDVNNASSYTRPWFAWANGLFGGLIIDLMDTRPWLLTDSQEPIRQ